MSVFISITPNNVPVADLCFDSSNRPYENAEVFLLCISSINHDHYLFYKWAYRIFTWTSKVRRMLTVVVGLR